MTQLAAIFACFLTVASASENGHASAIWITEKKELTKGETLRTAIRVRVDKGWHAYWQNPGHVGMPFTLKTDFPEGWEAGEIHYPSPKRLSVSGLVSFCLEGEFLLPVIVSPPSGFEGSLPPLSASLTWLACNDDSCVPGNAEITARAADTPDVVADAFSNLPKLLPGSRLIVTTDGIDISLSVTLPDHMTIDPSTCEVFPITKNIIDPAAKIAFEKKLDAPNTWHAKATKDEYFPDTVGVIEILLIAADKRALILRTE